MTVPLRLGVILLLVACCVSTVFTQTESGISCESKTVNLECTGGSLINVISANYGRTNSYTCSRGRPPGQVRKTDCINYSRSLSEVTKRCNGKSRCSVAASPSIFSDPCGGTFKYLNVSYTCLPASGADLRQGRLIRCERSSAVPWCPVGLIRIESAVYGRRSSAVCSFLRLESETRNTNCARDVTRTMAARCDGNKFCFVGVANSVFGDPCRGTYKYLDVKYYCLV